MTNPIPLDANAAVTTATTSPATSITSASQLMNSLHNARVAAIRVVAEKHASDRTVEKLIQENHALKEKIAALEANLSYNDNNNNDGVDCDCDYSAAEAESHTAIQRGYILARNAELIYEHNSDGIQYSQPVSDILESGTLIDPNSGDDLIITGIVVNINNIVPYC